MSSNTNGEKSRGWFGIFLGILLALILGLAVGYLVNEYQYNQAINESIDNVNESIDSINQQIQENETQRQADRDAQQSSPASGNQESTEPESTPSDN